MNIKNPPPYRRVYVNSKKYSDLIKIYFLKIEESILKYAVFIMRSYTNLNCLHFKFDFN